MKAAARGRLWLWAFCRCCGHVGKLPTHYAVCAAERGRIGGIARSLKCSKCGERSAARVMWNATHRSDMG